MTSFERLHDRMVRRESLRLSEALLWYLLLPLSVLYGLLACCRRALYRASLLSKYRAPVPVIAVGNLAVGGTGKTPVVDFLVRHYLERGIRVAVVSRGYGGSNVGKLRVVSEGDGPLVQARDCGDEPYLLALRNPSAIVVASPKRAVGIEHAVERLGAQCVILDDAFQHLAVERDLDLLLLDERLPFGNGFPLPAGNLREFPWNWRRADFIVYTRCTPSPPDAPARLRPSVRTAHRLGETWQDLHGRSVAAASLRPGRAVAFAGIARPEVFFEQLKDAGVSLAAALPFSDHCQYAEREITAIRAACRGADYLVTTEKDGVKLLGRDFPLPCYQVPLELEFLDGAAARQELLSRLPEEKQ